MANEDTILLLSGGLDSCVLLALLVAEGKRPLGLSFHYGQRHACELRCAAQLAKYYGIPHTTLTIDPLVYAQASSALVRPYDTPVSCDQPTYVPCRNMLFLAHAACVATSSHIQNIYFAANHDDTSHYPDCRPSFVYALEQTILCSIPEHFGPIKVNTPLIQMTKAQIVALGRKLGAPLEHTWSCYSPLNDRPCENCQACLLRRQALAVPQNAALS